MADKSEPPECVKDGWWQGRCFCLDKVGVLCSTAVQTGHMLDRYRWLTSSNLSLPPLSPSFPPSLAYPSFPQHIYFPLFFPLSLFRLPLSFSLFISQFLFPPRVFLCLGLCVFPLCISLAPFCACAFFSLSLLLFSSRLLPLHPSPLLYLSHLVHSDRPATGLSRRSGQKGGHGSISALMGLKVSWEGQLEKQPPCWERGNVTLDSAGTLGDSPSTVLETRGKLNRRWIFKVRLAGWKVVQIE